MKRMDKGFVYVPALRTDIRKTFARVRRELARGARPAAAGMTGTYLPLLPAQRAVQRRIDEECKR